MEQRERDVSGEWGMVRGLLMENVCSSCVQWYHYKRGKFGILKPVCLSLIFDLRIIFILTTFLSSNLVVKFKLKPRLIYFSYRNVFYLAY